MKGMFLVAVVLAAAPGIADRPQGVLEAARVRALRTIGEDVVRVSSTPALGAPGWIIEIHRGADGYGRGSVAFLRRGRDGWRVTGSAGFGMSSERYDRLARDVDAELVRGDPEARPTPTGQDIVICTDGPGWVTERRSAGREVRLAGFCAEQHPNATIVPLMERAAAAGLGWGDLTRSH